MDTLITKASPREHLSGWLKKALAAGPATAQSLTKQALTAGYNISTLQRAKKALGVVSVRVGLTWCWKLPEGDI